MRIFFFLVFSMTVYLVAGQSDSTTVVEEEYTKPWKYGMSTTMIGIHIMPLSFAGRHERLRLGVQLRNDRFSYLLDLEYGNRWLRDIPSTYNPLSYLFLGIRPEVRYSWHTGSWGDFTRYIGIEFPVTWYKKGLGHDAYTTDTLRYSFDSATVKRFRFGTLVKFGASFQIGTRGYFDYYMGVGWAHRYFHYDDVVNLQVTPEIVQEWGNLKFNNLPPGNKDVVDFAIGVRIGYFIVE